MKHPTLERDYADHVAWLRGRYEVILAEQGLDLLVLHSGVARKRSDFDDQYWPLRPSPYFQHWAPLSEADAALVIKPGLRPRLARMTSVDFWETAPTPESAHFVPHFDPLELRRFESLGAQIAGVSRKAFVGEDRGRAMALGFSDAEVNPTGLMASLDALRTRKTAYERLCIAEANRRAVAGHEALRRAFAAGAEVEFDLHLLYLQSTRQDDGETPYKNIVAMGRSAATLHHVTYRKHPEARASGASASLLVDAGATCLGYCSDITRSWVRGRGGVTEVYEALVVGVEEMQQRLCAEVKVGRSYEWLHDESHRQVGEILKSVGLLRCGAEDAVAAGVTRKFYPHGLGHSVGLQCHDVGCALLRPREDNPFLRNTAVIEPEQVFTIEPGIYFIKALLDELRGGEHGSKVNWSLSDELSVFGGVRIEDDVRVLPEGVENFTRAVLPVGGGRA